ncbi:MAG: hypothetical protein E7I13_05615 [Negativicoccus succinicivorans]|nr:hypothetical protein [Negativicoccus succinicivorans]
MENRIGPPSFDLHASKKVRWHQRLLMAFTLLSGFSAHGMILEIADEERADHFFRAENYPLALANVYNKCKSDEIR